VEQAELEALAPEVGYEVGMMAATAAFHHGHRQLSLDVERVVSFSLIEACLLHARNLDDFLGKPAPRPGDVLAVHYQPSWIPQRFLDRDERRAINTRLAHVTMSRASANVQWLVPLARRGLDAFGAFVASLDPEAAGWFRDDVAEAERMLATVSGERPQEAPGGP
jgi:hypothetical protein